MKDLKFEQTDFIKLDFTGGPSIKGVQLTPPGPVNRVLVEALQADRDTADVPENAFVIKCAGLANSDSNILCMFSHGATLRPAVHNYDIVKALKGNLTFEIENLAAGSTAIIVGLAITYIRYVKRAN